ncbi:MAG: hypothetical protein ABI614_02660 [Planctomycetota bacterium]
MTTTTTEIQALKAVISRLENEKDGPGTAATFESTRDMDQLFENLKSRLQMSGGPIDEGTSDNRNRVGTGSVHNWNTYPETLYVTPHSDTEKDFGTIAYHFSGRERVADYVLGQQRDTNDYQSSGRVTAEYDISRRGVVAISVLNKEGGRGRVGDAVVRHVDSLNGQNVS